MSADTDHPANEESLAHRARLPKLNDFDLATLLDLPPYWGWVEHRAKATTDTFRMFLGGNDDGVALRLYWNAQYEPKTLAVWMRLAQDNAMALDIGAHTGLYTLAAHAANAALNVLSFEPNILNYARLTLNLRANGLATTDAFMIGASDIDDTRAFTVRAHPDFHSSGGTFEAVDGGYARDVRVVALDSFLPAGIAGAIGLIKLDVEGHEAAALSGMCGTVARAHPTLIFECITAASAEAAEALLRPLGYRFYEIDDGAQTVREATHLAPILSRDGSADLNRLNRVAAQRTDDLAVLAAFERNGA